MKNMSKQIIGVLALLCSSVSMAATVTMVSTNLTPNVGDFFTVTLQASNFSDMGGGTLTIVWDTSKVTWVDAATNGGACSACLAPAGPVGVGTGTFVQMHLPTFDILPGNPPVNGNFDAAQFNFQAIAAGAMNLVINDDGGILTGWFDNTNADVIPTNYNQANIVVQGPPVPVPAAAWLLVSALGSMVVLKRRQA